MAHLDIQEKRSSSWIWWLLGLVVLAIIAWWLLSATNRREVTDAGIPPAPIGTTDPIATTPAPTGGTITDVSTLMNAENPAELMGRQVVLMGVPVSEAVSDKGFWIGSSKEPGQGLYAVRTNQMQPNTAPDGSVRSGENANVYGVVAAMPTNLNDKTTEWNLSATDQQALTKHRLYVHVDSVRLAND